MKKNNSTPILQTAVWLYFFFMIVPCAMGGAGVYFGASSYLQGLDTERTDGVVVALEEKEEEGTTYYRPVVEYTVGHGRFSCRGAGWSGVAFYSIGDPVHVLYKRDHPEVALIDSFFQRWLSPLVFFAASVLFSVLIVIGLLQRIRQGKDGKRKGEVGSERH